MGGQSHLDMYAINKLKPCQATITILAAHRPTDRPLYAGLETALENLNSSLPHSHHLAVQRTQTVFRPPFFAFLHWRRNVSPNFKNNIFVESGECFFLAMAPLATSRLGPPLRATCRLSVLSLLSICLSAYLPVKFNLLRLAVCLSVCPFNCPVCISVSVPYLYLCPSVVVYLSTNLAPTSTTNERTNEPL